MKPKDLLKSSAFMMSMALIVALLTNFAGIFPGEVLDADVRSDLTVFFLALMLTISLSRIPFSNLNPVSHWRSVLRAVLLGLVVSSLIPLAGYWLLKDTEYGAQAMGLVFIAATPFAASVAPLSYVLNGDMEHAARGTIVVYLVSLVWIPFVIWLALGELVDMSSVVVTVVEIIGVPLVLSRLLTRFRIDKDLMAVFLNCCIFLLVWLSVGSTSFVGSAWVFLAFIVIAALRSFGLGNVVETVEKRAGIHWSQRVTDILMTSYKNKGIAIAMCMAVLAPTGLAPLAMVAIATSIVVEICWVIFMDSVLFSRRRMERELAAEAERGASLLRRGVVPVVHVLQDVAGLAVQGPAYPVQCGEPDGADLPRLDVREVHVGDPDLLRQLLQGDLAVGHHPVEAEHYGHGITGCGPTRSEVPSRSGRRSTGSTAPRR